MSDFDKKRIMRLKVAQEIVDTEVRYVEKLKILHLLFFRNLKGHIKLNKTILAEKEISEIFMNLEDVYKLNKSMCDELIQLRFKGDEELIEGISTILLKFTPFMKIYTTYMDKYMRSCEVIESMRKRKSFVEFLEINELLAEEDLASLLILPVQRIPRYILLMKELLKNSDSRKEELKENIELLEKTASIIDMNVKKTEAREKVVKIQQFLFKNEINIIAPHRYVVAIAKLSIRENSALFKRSILCLFVLLNDLLLWATLKHSGKYYKVRTVVPLEIISAKIIESSNTKNEEAAFLLTCLDPKIKSIEVIVENVQSRNRWVNLITQKKAELVSENKSSGKKYRTLLEVERDVLKSETKNKKTTIKVSKSSREEKSGSISIPENSSLLQ